MIRRALVSIFFGGQTRADAALGTGQHFRSPACPELTRNRPA